MCIGHLCPAERKGEGEGESSRGTGLRSDTKVMPLSLQARKAYTFTDPDGPSCDWESAAHHVVLESEGHDGCCFE